MTRLSIIIPVHDRYERLRACLESLRANMYDGTAEVVVVNDGGPDQMRELEVEWNANGPKWEMIWIEQPKSGPAAARNRAIRESNGEVILFLNDDVVLEPKVLAAHDEAHRRQPGHAVMGNTRWDPEIVSSEFMHWCAHHDHVHYLVGDHSNMSWEFFHTLNGSIDRVWFERGEWFDETFPDPAFEDTEHVYRLTKKGMRISFAPDAVVYHHHYFEPDQYLSKSVMRGRSARKFLELYPELTARIVGEYEEAIGRSPRARLFWREVMGMRDGPNEWYARIAMAFMAGYHEKPVPRAARRCR